MNHTQSDPRELAREIERLKAGFALYVEGSQQLADGMKEVVYLITDLQLRIAALERNWGGEGFNSSALR